ncbi:hypothetical protein [Actinacidiphila acididurans]|uniref:MmcB family DNA repair protein n=1 Tax=Actinacidiphila acididurans TaxID=2784346 RepID=A0ABS2U2X2_9ACTN|nr:hypothetical protein [Actinacidiphila acididurans]MBM9509931.1 hypothetical protein [Actinacidiphila acididurans]
MTTTVTEPEASGKGPTKQLEELLHAHFIKPDDQTSVAGAGAIYLTEVTAPGSNRRADVVHIGLWQSRGAGRIDVCELKTSRSDFLRELNDPAKAEAWWPYSTAFWLVVPHLSIAGPDDLPAGWGLMVPSGRGRRFKTVVKPAEREPRIDIPLLVTLLKNTETVRTNSLGKVRTDLVNQAYRREQELRRELNAHAVNPRTVKRLELLDLLEEALGERLDTETWHDRLSAPDAASALRAFVLGQKALTESRKEMERRAREFDRIRESATRAAADLRAALALPAADQLPAKEA